MSIWRMTIRISSPVLGGFGSNTWHMRSDDTGPLDPTDASDLTEMVKDFYTAIAGHFVAGTSLLFDGSLAGVGADEGDSTTAPTWTVNSTGGPSSLPPANCYVVGWKTSGGGRSGRGRTFVGPLSADTLEGNGTPSAGVRNQALAAAAALIASSSEAENGALGVFSQQDGLLRDFIGAAVRDQYAVLRSRRD